ncbi:Xaa-Pro aminopeptidase [Pasteurellaceae bacterium HPA106]|uniref:Xaa-Pro aminopeptidase n=1 Tax=Spirabiliibacterium pneumoniae TaxID=221400 RepID=UPI001AADDD26|nr:Xaa-Pro aminopeptidase [Spirabiliibacterium pneumoniae]MBE2895796.1 Xaa-Pro aminopeptidase [Spirabiliibacterium pneumoniae]
MDLSYKSAIDVTEFHQRRETLGAQLQNNSALLLFSNQEQRRNSSNTYPFRQDSYFWYLTGFNEPDSALLIQNKASSIISTLFLRPSDPLLETWNGRRLGVENAPAKLQLDAAFSIDDIATELPKLLSGATALYHAPDLQPWGDQIEQTALCYLREHTRQGFNVPNTLIDWRPLLDEMRLFKSPAEIALIQQAGQISALGHIRAMKTARANRFEYELESELLHEFNRFGARFPSYNSIVASGENACILHYTENESLLRDGDLVMIDAGAEFAMYAGDISRTFPVNGRFTPEQRAIYDIVLRAEKRAIELYVPGNSIKQANLEVLRIMLSGLVELGILQGDVEQLIKEKAYLPFYMHGLGHWLGLDVHDVGDYGCERDRTFEPNMVLTVEPGLYLSEKLDIPERYKGIGVRIEDNILITETGNKILTAAVPKEPEDIERLMQSSEPSHAPTTL